MPDLSGCAYVGFTNDVVGIALRDTMFVTMTTYCAPRVLTNELTPASYLVEQGCLVGGLGTRVVSLEGVDYAGLTVSYESQNATARQGLADVWQSVIDHPDAQIGMPLDHGEGCTP